MNTDNRAMRKVLHYLFEHMSVQCYGKSDEWATSLAVVGKLLERDPYWDGGEQINWDVWPKRSDRWLEGFLEGDQEGPSDSWHEWEGQRLAFMAGFLAGGGDPGPMHGPGQKAWQAYDAKRRGIPQRKYVLNA
jgi:hypothetical protein